MEVSLNLLPQEKKKEIFETRRFKAVLLWESVILIVILGAMLFLFSINYILGLDAKLIQESQSLDSDKEQYKLVKKYEENFSQVNSKINKINTIKNDQLYWSHLFLKLSKLTPQNISLSQITTKDLTITLLGNAARRDDLIDFKDKLEEDSDTCFESVDLPLSNLVSKENVNFQINLKINKKCLQENETIPE